MRLTKPCEDASLLVGEEWSVADYAQGRPLERGEITSVFGDQVTMTFARMPRRIPEHGVLLPYLGPT